VGDLSSGQRRVTGQDAARVTMDAACGGRDAPPRVKDEHPMIFQQIQRCKAELKNSDESLERHAQLGNLVEKGTMSRIGMLWTNRQAYNSGVGRLYCSRTACQPRVLTDVGLDDIDRRCTEELCDDGKW
jgi:hypothetical protein